MDTRFVLQGITFIWDENKARENPRHHDGMTFEQAAEAFFDPFLKVVEASRNEVSATAWKCTKTGKMKMSRFSGTEFAVGLA